MKTLFLGSYGFGNLGDELCLIDAVRRFEPSEAWAFSSRPEYTKKWTGVENYISDRNPIREMYFDRVVLGGGGVGFWPSLRDSIHWMWDVIRFNNPNAETHIYNISVGVIRNPDWFSDGIVKNIIENLTSYSVRDHVSQWLARDWGLGRIPDITYYPEKDLPAEAFPLPTFPRNAVGISITSQPLMMRALDMNRDVIKKFIDGMGDFEVVPIVSTVHQDDHSENDIDGFNKFYEMFLNNKKIVLPEMLDQGWRNANLTPLRLKYIISKLSLIISQRKHNVIHAIGSKIPYVGIFPDIDDSILRIMFTLRHVTVPGSSFISLRTGEYREGG